MKNKKKGFTLYELIVVIAIIGVLSAIIIPAVIKMTGKGEDENNSTSTRAVITLNENESITVEVDRWYHTSGKQLKIIAADGTEYYVSEDDAIIIKEKVTRDEHD